MTIQSRRRPIRGRCSTDSPAGAAAGLAINPPTPLAAIEAILTDCDLVLVMSVSRALAGRSSSRGARQAAAALDRAPDVVLEVDGGVNDATIGRCARRGPNCLSWVRQFFIPTTTPRRFAN